MTFLPLGRFCFRFVALFHKSLESLGRPAERRCGFCTGGSIGVSPAGIQPRGQFPEVPSHRLCASRLCRKGLERRKSPGGPFLEVPGQLFGPAGIGRHGLQFGNSALCKELLKFALHSQRPFQVTRSPYRSPDTALIEGRGSVVARKSVAQWPQDRDANEIIYSDWDH